MIDFIGIASLAIICLIQRYVLSNNRHTWLGGVLPALFIIGIITTIIVKDMEFNFSNMSLLFFGTTFLLGLWMRGHESYKEKITEEYKQTQAKDNQQI